MPSTAQSHCVSVGVSKEQAVTIITAFDSVYIIYVYARNGFKIKSEQWCMMNKQCLVCDPVGRTHNKSRRLFGVLEYWAMIFGLREQRWEECSWDGGDLQ